MSQQTTDHEHGSSLPKCTGAQKNLTLFLKHLYGTESSVTLRATQMFAQEAPNVKWTRQGTVGNSILQIKKRKLNLKKIKSLLKIPWKNLGEVWWRRIWISQEVTALHWSKVLSCWPAHSSYLWNTEWKDSSCRKKPSFSNECNASSQGLFHTSWWDTSTKASQVREESTTCVHCHTHNIHQPTFMCLRFWD